MSPFNLTGTSSFHTLEITVLSCEDLRINGRSVKKNTCVVARTDPLNFRETTTDTEGGSYPSWNQKLVLDMSIRETCITLEVHCRTLSVDRIIGSARMPVSDFMGGYFPEGYLSFLSYRLKDPKGYENGIVNVSVRIRAPEYLARKKKVILPEDKCLTSQPALALPAMDGKNYDGVDWYSGSKY
ncbi:BON1-associated protein 2 [Populus alba x Populus x berolinensis]|nr:BON1-associated protein 2 [Populus alba x Populus x berolinensis]